MRQLNYTLTSIYLSAVNPRVIQKLGRDKKSQESQEHNRERGNVKEHSSQISFSKSWISTLPMDATGCLGTGRCLYVCHG